MLQQAGVTQSKFDLIFTHVNAPRVMEVLQDNLQEAVSLPAYEVPCMYV